MLNKIIINMLIGFSASLAMAEFVAEPIPSSGVWNAEKVENHEIWNTQACVASTETEDGDILEVIAYYDEESGDFLDPEVNVITSFDVAFLDVVGKIRGESKEYSMTPMSTDDENVVGARAAFRDRERLVGRLRAKSWYDVSFIDTEGVVKTLNFSLTGSSNTIRNQFSACALKFEGLPEELPILDELD